MQEAEGEPRILDTDLARALGMSQERDIRSNSIKPNLEELQRLGPLRTTNAMVNAGSGAQRSVETYYLNENQAAYVAILSRTRAAAEIRISIIMVVKGEPRILDTDLARALGMSQERDIRSDLIKPNLEELQRLGILRETPANSGQRGRSTFAYFPNEEQATATPAPFSQAQNPHSFAQRARL
ncbi:hypothetical protein ABS772_23705 [Methylorubrum podarium]|uniref:Uncharacterized protein n=1 Tax=Methylorubrum podarium TaxID=200476 RepID=A0ABV1QU25_9HYPH